MPVEFAAVETDHSRIGIGGATTFHNNITTTVHNSLIRTTMDGIEESLTSMEQEPYQSVIMDANSKESVMRICKEDSKLNSKSKAANLKAADVKAADLLGTEHNVPFQLKGESKFLGHQKSGKSCYNVEIEIKHVNLKDSFMCGYLKIKDLTDDWPQLCTFFEGEIIGEKYSFVTRKWDADETIDRQHWIRFPSFQEDKQLMNHFNDESFTYNHFESDYIYMRWKELFLVPDHHIKSISGASFAGFYYIAFQKSTGTIQGIYFHHNSEWFQQLSLEYIPSQSWGSWEFR